MWIMKAKRINERNIFRNRLISVTRKVDEHIISLVMFEVRVDKTKTPSTQSDNC